jgi:SPP1 gp7 family putative phage head morphogenesis protein
VANKRYKLMRNELLKNVLELADNETNFVKKALGDMTRDVEIKKVIPDSVKNNALRHIMDNGQSVDDFINYTVAFATGQVTSSVKSAIAQGQSLEDFRSDLLGSPKNNYANSVMLNAAKNVSFGSRTLTNAIGNIAQRETYQANDDIIIGERYMATLDSRTSSICASLDGTYFKIGEGAQPPLHPNCRSVRIPEIDPKYKLSGIGGERRAKGSKGVNIVSSKTTYSTWLKRQPADFIDDVLGKKKGLQFRKGELDFNDIRDTSKYNGLTLEQLRDRS